tara:strand:- start:7486 stop:7785 length:300 start_codon:yes stop_codon:yes gene_type:complete
MSILNSFSSNNANNANNASIGSFTFTIQYGTEKVHVDVRPDDPTSPESLDAALKVYAGALGYDFSRPVTWRRGSENVEATTRPQAGETYQAAMSHEQKG